MSRKKRGRRPVKRRERLPQFVVFCEGKTEVEYIDYVRSALPTRAVALRTYQPGAARITLARKAAEAASDFKRNWKDVDWAIWILCDVDDEGPKLLELGAGARSGASERWAISNPAIAVWLLMHVEYVTRHEHRDTFAREAGTAGLLAGKNYKDLEPGELIGRSGVACERAERLRRRHANNGTLFPNDNPSSSVDRMLADLVKMYNTTPAGRASPVSLHTLY